VARHNLLAAANARALEELERDPGGKPGRAPPPEAQMIWCCPNPSCGATFPTEAHFLKHGRMFRDEKAGLPRYASEKWLAEHWEVWRGMGHPTN